MCDFSWVFCFCWYQLSELEFYCNDAKTISTTEHIVYTLNTFINTEASMLVHTCLHQQDLNIP